MTSSPWVATAFALSGLLLLGACVEVPDPGLALQPESGGQETQERQATNDATPTPTPTPASAPAQQRVEPGLSRQDAEHIVFAELSACAESLAGGSPNSARIAFHAIFDPDARSWMVNAETSDGRLTLGNWQVEDRDTPFALPIDVVATTIGSGESRCASPAALLDGVPTPPRFVDLYERAAEVGLLTAGQAEVRVWVALGDCFTEEPRPPIGVFSAKEEKPGRWIVEGRNDDNLYGLWLVESDTGTITALDEEARRTMNRSCFQRLD